MGLIFRVTDSDGYYFNSFWDAPRRDEKAMTERDRNFTVVGRPRGRRPFDNGSGHDLEARMRRVEDAITRIEAHMEHMASREFIYKAILGGLALAAALTVAITRLLP